MTLAVFLLIGVVTLAVAGVGLLFFTREFKESVASRQFSAVSLAAGELDARIVAARRELMAVAQNVPPELSHDPAAMRRFLDKRLDLRQTFDAGVGFFSVDSRLHAFSPSDRPFPDRYLPSNDFFIRTLRSGDPCISGPYRPAENDGRPVALFTAAVRDRQGRVSGVLVGRVDLSAENFLNGAERLRIGEQGDFFLFNKQRELVVHRNPEKAVAGWLAPGKNLLLDRAVAGFEGSGETVAPGAGEAVCSFRRLKSAEWILAAQLPVSAAYAPVHRACRLILCTLAVVTPLALWSVWLFVGHLTAPLLLFAGRVREMGRGSAGYQAIPVTTGDEIGVLAQAFNSMMRELGRQRSLLEKEKVFSEQLLQQTAVPCFVIDADHRLIIWNRACEELTGVSAERVIGGSDPWRGFYEGQRRVLADVVVDGTPDEMAQLYGRHAVSPLITEGLRAEGWFRLKGRQKFLCFDAAPIRDGEGRVIAAIETMQDVTLRANTEEQLRSMVTAIGESEERFRRLVELSRDGIAILVERRFVFINPAGCAMLGCGSQYELIGREMREFIQRESEEVFEEQLQFTEQSRSCAPWIEERLLRHDRTTTEVEVGVSRFVYRGEDALQVIFRDVTERRSAKAKLEALAHYDSLTTLPNRVLFFDRLRHVLAEAERYSHAFALMFIDLDGFKQVNDTLGHAGGDAVLVEAGQRLKDCVRACDMVARMGGDEFTVILSKIADQDDAAYVAERVVEALNRPFLFKGATAGVGVSIGIYVYPSYPADLDGMVRNADLALYRAKEQGKNRYRFYTPQSQDGGVRDVPGAETPGRDPGTGVPETRSGEDETSPLPFAGREDLSS